VQLSRFIATRLALGKFKSFTSFIIKLAWFGVGLSVAVMIIATAVVIGYKQQITDKVVGFGGHIEIHATGTTGSFDYMLFKDSVEMVKQIKTIPNVKSVAPILSKPGILKANEDLEGIVFKGVDGSYDFTFFNKNLLRGRVPNTKDSTTKREIMISQILAKKMQVDTGKTVKIFFINDPVRVIPCKIVGIYETGLEENDMVYVIGSLREMQRIFAARAPMITHYEINTHDFKQLLATNKKINRQTPEVLNAENMVQMNPQIFDWLGYLDQNITIILGLMIVVACINMITALLILIIERTNMVGILKALGSRNNLIKRVFLNHAFYILILGLIFGNILGLGACYLQDHFKLITLPRETYYLSFVPIQINWLYVLLINIGTVALCMIALLFPVRMINSIAPVKAIKFN
jgi:lipoprotein-releasing system permease protein